ncbi:MAG: hypothetical protein N3A54_00990 [Patescibacteria group bacterium]|nr:hypothetical protein [Patescibacteria group bacterium]
MMEKKYNKKNNTYFIYEMLVRKYVDLFSVSVPKREMLLKMLHTYFNVNTVLGRERKLYEQIVFLHEKDLTEEERRYVLRKCKDSFLLLQEKNTKLLREGVLNTARKLLNSDDFLNYRIDNYKFLANIYHYFTSNDFGESLELEKKLLEQMQEYSGRKKEKTKLILNGSNNVGNFVTEDMLVLQTLLSDGNAGGVLFLYEKIDEYKKILLEHSVCSECEVCDVEMKSGILKVFHKLEEFKNREIREEDLKFLNDVSELVSELKGD